MGPLEKLARTIRDFGIENFGRYYGTYTGIVIDNNDPEKVNRLSVYVPEVYGAVKTGYWAKQKNVYSGKGFGIQCLPSVNDTVTISFKFGDKKFPLWDYGRFMKNNKPDDFSDITVKGLILPSGQKIIFTENTVLLYNKDGQSFYLTDQTTELGDKDSTKEFAAKGDTTIDKLEELTNLVMSLVFVTPSGNTTSIAAPTVLQFENFKNTLSDIKSKSVKVD